MASQQTVRFGSEADITRMMELVRLVPEADIPACPSTCRPACLLAPSSQLKAMELGCDNARPRSHQQTTLVECDALSVAAACKR